MLTHAQTELWKDLNNRLHSETHQPGHFISFNVPPGHFLSMPAPAATKERGLEGKKIEGTVLKTPFGAGVEPDEFSSEDMRLMAACFDNSPPKEEGVRLNTQDCAGPALPCEAPQAVDQQQRWARTQSNFLAQTLRRSSESEAFCLETFQKDIYLADGAMRGSLGYTLVRDQGHDMAAAAVTGAGGAGRPLWDAAAEPVSRNSGCQFSPRFFMLAPDSHNGL